MKSRILRKTALTLAVLVLVQTLAPSVAYALTSGPAQPEFQGFQQVGASDMVDLFSGDFSHNIPLCEIGGYPLNIVYNSNPGMDDEASWVGLGWSLNPGAINRQLRGLPDDFKGDAITKEFNISADRTIGISVGPDFEIFGKKPTDSLSLGFNVGITNNTRRGYEMTTGLNFEPALAVGKANKQLTGNLGLSFAPSSGLQINSKIGLPFIALKNTTLQNSVSAGFNSRTGLKDLTFQSSISKGILKAGYNRSFLPGPYTYTPTSLLPLKNRSFVFRATIGGEVFGVHPNIELYGFVNKQELSTNTEEQLAYGYLHLKEGKANEAAHLDYNSELNGQFKENAPHLPLAYGTPDVFSISGHGIGGQFKATRNDVGIFRPAIEKNSSIGGSVGGEIGLGGFVHGGTNVTATFSNTVKKEWGDKRIDKNLAFTENATGNDYEAVYFKRIGEKTLLPENATADIFPRIGQTSPTRIGNDRLGLELFANSVFVKEENGEQSSFFIDGLIQNKDRVRRNQVISYLTVKEASKVGLDKQIFSYKNGSSLPYDILYSGCFPLGSTDREAIERNDKARPEHHISEIKVTDASGGRYVYGLPVYNNKQRDVTFSIDGANLITGQTNTRNHENYGLVNYAKEVDNSINNRKGTDHYFDATELPPYAHSYLLTGVLSPDYVDRTGDGITEDDSGNAVKFNYTRHSEKYNWRIPVQKNQAKFHEGLEATSDDDKASYLYGEKEIWYPYSIESRSMIARFYTSIRKDGLGVLDEDGGAVITQNLSQLDSIKILSKADLITNGSAAVPIKTIHFRYNYELCQGVPNSLSTEKGKLTLKKIFFTYGNNNSGKLNAYKFDYKGGVNAETFDYNMGNYDRWGYLKQNPGNYPLNHKYPYVLQEEEALNQQYAGAWNLSEIILPSGSKIKIDYEPDDYAYVQEKRAGQMMEIIGFSDLLSTDDDLKTIYTKDGKDIINKKYLVVRLPQHVQTEEEGRKRYLEDIEQIYFDCLVKLEDGNEDSFERVNGYLSISETEPPRFISTTNSSNNFDQLYIPVRFLEDNKDNDVHPITFAALQKMRLEIPELIFPGLKNTDDDDENILKSMVGLAREIGNIFKGFEQNSMRKGYGKYISSEENSSWLRLYTPDYKKTGGGSRVAKITISDEWNTSDGGVPSEYGQTYNYEIPITINGNTEMISSGVASYEPAIGGEENMMKLPLPYQEKYLLAPKNEFYSETPVGESLFPSPMVGYSQVIVKDIANDRSALDRNQTGHTVHNFYTAKDFPTVTKRTKINPQAAKPNPILKVLKIGVFDARSFSQGYTIELNDMHGKPRAQSIFDKNGALLSSTAYNYRIDNEDALEKTLSNQVPVLSADNTIEEAQLGVCMDTWVEMIEESNVTTTAGVVPNVDVIPIAIFPASVFTVYPLLNNEETQFKAAVTTKLVQRCGILDNVVVMENGSTITTRNQLYDKETGSVLLTETQNEFDDKMYNFSYPAHWVYDGMGQAYKDIGFKYTFPKGTTGIIPNNLAPFFQPGTEIVIEKIAATNLILPDRYFIGRLNENNLIPIDENGNRYVPDSQEQIQIRVIRSSKRNLLSANVGQVTSRQTPIVGNKVVFSPAQEVLNSSAVTFKEDWKIQCKLDPSKADNCGIAPVDTKWEFNLYAEGLRGNWRPHESFVYYDHRSASEFVPTSNMHIRNTGTANTFDPFWQYNGSWEKANIDIQKWVPSNTSTLYDFRGNQLESVDALKIPSAAYFGYNRNKATAVAGNTEYKEIVYDGFEDYDYDIACREPISIPFRRNLDFSESPVEMTQAAAHTGKYALAVYEDLIEFCKYTKKLDAVCNINTISEGDLTDLIPPFPIDPCENCQATLEPYRERDYNLAVWMATPKSLDCGAPPEGYKMTVQFKDKDGAATGNLLELAPKGPVIEGWQQIDEKISIPKDAGYITIAFATEGASFPELAYFDDFRFHPWLSNMQSYVYDPVSERLMATLDDNNYASFYEYNDEGLLVRTKRETEKGIVTIQEGRTVLKPNNNP